MKHFVRNSVDAPARLVQFGVCPCIKTDAPVFSVLAWYQRNHTIIELLLFLFTCNFFISLFSKRFH